MAKKRLVNTRFWDDEYVCGLSRDEKLLFLYALTNPLTELCGAYQITLKRIVFDTGMDEAEVLAALRKFEEADKICYRDGWMLIKNFGKHQASNPNVNKGVARSLNSCPDWIKQSLSKPFKAFESLSTENAPEPEPEPEPKPEPNGVCAPRVRAREAVAAGDVRANPVSQDERLYIDTVINGLLERLKVVVLRDQHEWLDTIDFARMNGFPAAAVLETYDLLRRQKWRRGRITARTVGDNLTHLEAIRKEIAEQDDGSIQKNNRRTGGKRSNLATLAESEDYFRQKYGDDAFDVDRTAPANGP